MAHRTLALAAVLALAGTAPTQVPAGWCVVSTFRDPNFTGATGGLFFVHPRTGATVAVQGLPATLTGAGIGCGSCGADSVVWRPSDGALLVGELAESGPVSVHVLTLQGDTVVPTASTVHVVGTAGGGASGVNGLALLPNGDLLVAGRTASGALATPSGLLVLSTSTGLATPVPVSGITGVTPNAVAVDPAGQVAYLGFSSPSAVGQVWKVPVPGGGAAQWVATLNGGVVGLDVLADGRLLVGTFGGTPLGASPNLFEVDPSSGQVTAVPVGRSVRNAVAVERATGSYVVVESVFSNPYTAGVSWTTPSGPTQALTFGPAAGWGVVSGIDVHPNPSAYGDPTPSGGADYRWRLAPNPGGLPLVGNLQFGLRAVPAAGPPAPGVWFASKGRASIPFQGLRLLVDPAPGQLLVGGAPLTASGDLPLPIPANGSLVGATFHVQALFVTSSSIQASDGATVTVL